MTRAIKHTPPNPLAGTVDDPEGIAVADLASEAEARVVAMQSRLVAFARDQMQAIQAFAAHDEATLFAQSLELGTTATHLAETAGAAGLDAVGEAARGLAEMIDALMETGVWHTDALRLHMHALQLLDRDAPDPDEVRAMLARLARMRASIGVDA